MPIKTSCPDCDRSYNLADSMEGKTVKCKDCGNSFTVESAAPTVTAVAAAPVNGKVKTGLGAAKTGKAGNKRRMNDDDDEARPRKKKQKGSPNMALLIGGGVAAVLFLLVLVGAGVLALVFWPSSKKKEDTTATLNANPSGDNKPVVANGNPLSPVTKANFDKIRGGMTDIDLFGIIQGPTTWGVPLDKDSATFDKATANVWKNGQDSITITYCAGKTCRWVGVFAGQTYPMQDSTYILTKSTSNPSPTPNPNPVNPGPASLITKANFDQIKGGWNPAQLQGLLGVPTKPNAPIDPAAQASVGTKGKTQVWQNGADSITVTYYNNQATHWVAMIGGQTYGPVDDPNYALKNTNPNPGTPTTKVTRANYNLIAIGTPMANVYQLVGTPANVQQQPRGGVVRGRPPEVDMVAQWNDGQGGTMTVHFRNGLVSNKSERGLR